jgi:glyoxylase-like metal-dependent hydrolase (beta-lactamase superfamily II)
MAEIGPPERAWFLSVGAFRSPSFALGQGEGLGALSWLRLSNAILVVEHRGGEVTLVDAGWSEAQCRAPFREIGIAQSLLLGVSLRAGDDARAQLARRGIAPERVRRIVATHLHVDHVGGLDDFPDAEVITTPDELASARARGRVHGFDVSRLARIGRLTLVTLDGPARDRFAASCALGPGITLLDARGHTAGSVAVEVALGETRLLHLGDAAYTLEEAERDRPSPLSRRTAWDGPRQRETYRAIAEAVRQPDVVAITSHDPRTWTHVEGKVFARTPSAHAPASA